MTSVRREALNALRRLATPWTTAASPSMIGVGTMKKKMLLGGSSIAFLSKRAGAWTLSSGLPSRLVSLLLEMQT
jgi:hypothetical protein